MDGLILHRCEGCDCIVYPPKPSCPSCAGATAETAVDGDGSVFTFTVAHHAYNPEVATPFVIALVELAGVPGVRVVANIPDCKPDSVRIGMPVWAWSGQVDELGIRPVQAAPR